MGVRSGLKLNFLKLRYFLKFGSAFFYNQKFFENKRIIILGAADSSMNYLPGEEIDKFDIIVRVNVGNIVAEKFPESLGSRTDILFHALCPSQTHGLKALDQEILSKQNTNLVLYPQGRPKTTRRFYKYALKNPEVPIKRVPVNFWQDISAGRGKRIPTTGLAAIYFLLNQPFSELHITGFTFYKTDYVQYYEKDVSKEKVLVETVDRHNHDQDFEDFVNLYKKFKKSGKTIVLDPVLQSLVGPYL